MAVVEVVVMKWNMVLFKCKIGVINTDIYKSLWWNDNDIKMYNVFIYKLIYIVFCFENYLVNSPTLNSSGISPLKESFHDSKAKAAI
jgi:hypothetical protein